MSSRNRGTNNLLLNALIELLTPALQQPAVEYAKGGKARKGKARAAKPVPEFIVTRAKNKALGDKNPNKVLAAELRKLGIVDFQADVTTPDGTMSVWQAAKRYGPDYVQGYTQS